MPKFFSFIFSIVFLTATHLSAQNQASKDSINKFNEVEIVYQADKLTPVTFQNINSEAFEIKSTGQEPSFLLSETPSITVYSDAGNSQGYSYFRMRGIDQTRINITLDGIPLNEPEDQGAYFSNYPDILNSVSKIQIQRGVGTTQNGVASFGGSVQLFSPQLNDSSRGSFGIGYGSFNSYRAFGEYQSGLKNNKAIYIRASRIHSDGYKYNSANSSQSAFISSAWFREKTNWKLNLLAGQQQNQLAWFGVSDSLISIDRKTNANVNENDRFTQGLVQLQNNWQLNNFSLLQSGVYYTFLRGNYDFNLNNFLGLPTTDELYNYAFQSNLTGFFSNYSFSKNRFYLTTGIHGNIYNRDHSGSEKTFGQLYKNTGYKNEFSFFTKSDYSINRFTVFTDIQYRFSSFDYKGSVAFDKMKWHFINPKIGLTAQIKPNTVLYYSFGSTGREPTRNDMFGGNDDLAADSLGNPALFIKTPEYVYNQELGIRYQTQKATLNLNLFFMDFKNEIVLDGKFGPNGLALTNKVERSYRSGIEVNMTYQITDNFSLTNNASFNYSRIKEQTEVFSPILTPPVIINQEAVYSFKNLSIGLIGRYQDKSFIDFANTSVVQSYFLLNGRVHYKINKLQLGFFANNLTNSKYFNQGYVDFDGSKKYFVQAPANFYASITYSF